MSEIDAIRTRLTELGGRMTALVPDPTCDVSVEEVEPCRLLTLRWEDDGGEVVFTLEPVPEGTRLVVVESSPEWSTALELRALAACAVA